MTETPNHNYNVPAQGTQDWHTPLNENFEAFEVDIELRDEAANLSSYEPAVGAKFLATDTGVVYTGDGNGWVPQFVLPGYDQDAGEIQFDQPLVVSELAIAQLRGSLTDGNTLTTIAGNNLSIDSNGQLNASTGSGGGNWTENNSLLEPTDSSILGIDVDEVDTSTMTGPVTGGTPVTDIAGNNLSIDSNGQLNASTGSGGGNWTENNSLLEPTDSSVLGIDVDEVNTGTVDTTEVTGSLTGGNSLTTIAGNNLSIDSNGQLNAATGSGGISNLAGGDGIAPGTISDGDTVSVTWADANNLDADGNVSADAVDSSAIQSGAVGTDELSTPLPDLATLFSDPVSTGGTLHVSGGGSGTGELTNDQLTLNGPTSADIYVEEPSSLPPRLTVDAGSASKTVAVDENGNISAAGKIQTFGDSNDVAADLTGTLDVTGTVSVDDPNVPAADIYVEEPNSLSPRLTFEAGSANKSVSVDENGNINAAGKIQTFGDSNDVAADLSGDVHVTGTVSVDDPNVPAADIYVEEPNSLSPRLTFDAGSANKSASIDEKGNISAAGKIQTFGDSNDVAADLSGDVHVTGEVEINNPTTDATSTLSNDQLRLEAEDGDGDIDSVDLVTAPSDSSVVPMSLGLFFADESEPSIRFEQFGDISARGLFLDSDLTFMNGLDSGTGANVVSTNGTLVVESSSARHKTDIEPHTTSPGVLDLELRSFEYEDTETEDVGYIAEEVEEHLPEIVTYDENGRPHSVKYDRVGPHLVPEVRDNRDRLADIETAHEDTGDRVAELEMEIEAKEERIEAQAEQIDEQNERIAALEAENETLRERLAAVEDRLATIETDNPASTTADD